LEPHTTVLEPRRALSRIGHGHRDVRSPIDGRGAHVPIVRPVVAGREFAAAPRVPARQRRGARGRRDGDEVGSACHAVSIGTLS
jgi:hypothetical protein